MFNVKISRDVTLKDINQTSLLTLQEKLKLSLKVSLTEIVRLSGIYCGLESSSWNAESRVLFFFNHSTSRKKLNFCNFFCRYFNSDRNLLRFSYVGITIYLAIKTDASLHQYIILLWVLVFVCKIIGEFVFQILQIFNKFIVFPP